MEIDKLNAFLATALGGLIFKWLAGTIKVMWEWANKVYPEEKFLVNELNLNASLIRMSYCRYSKKIKKKDASKLKKQKYIGFFIAISFFILSFWFVSTIDDLPLKSMEVTMNSTHDKIWINPNEAKNPNKKTTWRITAETCKFNEKIDNIKEIKQETKKEICRYMLVPDAQEKLKKLNNRNFLSYILLITIGILSLLYIMTLGTAMMIDAHVVTKINEYNEKEASRIWMYVT